MKITKEKYFDLLREKYPSKSSLCSEIINLNAILNLPKGTEHFMSDLHGEYKVFLHILNNCSGVIREKADMVFGQRLSGREIGELCTLIYYPEEKLEMLKDSLDRDRYRVILNRLLELAGVLSSKYTRSKVRKAIPKEFEYIVDELLHAQKDEDDNQILYHKKIIDTILDTNIANEFIISLSVLIKRLAVDRLHIVGDIFDRGSSPDKILDLLSNYHSLDIEWGNHDILWLGAACGSEPCIATAVYNSLRYGNTEFLENRYGISLRQLALFAENTYEGMKPMEAALHAISVIKFKLEGQLIMRNPDYQMDNRLLLDKIDFNSGTIELDGVDYELKNKALPTLNAKSPYSLTKGESEVVSGLVSAFLNSRQLQKHAKFLYQNGGMYKIYNGNLLYHGCIPLDATGNPDCVVFEENIYYGRGYLDYADSIARRAFFGKRRQEDLDFMWYLWCGKKSPLFGRNEKSFEHIMLKGAQNIKEERNPYYKFQNDEKTCNMILREFGLFAENSHIINGHTPIKAKDGESPIKADGRLLVIDGGFCENYHKTTGIAGYTLIYNSHGLRLKSHQPFESVDKALLDNTDIKSSSELIETAGRRVMVKDTDNGKQIVEKIEELKDLLREYEIRLYE